MNPMLDWRPWAVALVAGWTVTAAHGQGQAQVRGAVSVMAMSLESYLAQQSNTQASGRARAALGLLAEGRFEAASKAVNEAVQLEPRNAGYHFLNGWVYHVLSRDGDAEKLSMAQEGYRQAVRLDASHWIAHEFLGLAYWEQRRYSEAQAEFAEVVLARPSDIDAKGRLLAASYMAGDVSTACALADQLPEGAESLRGAVLRTKVLVYAACGEWTKAQGARSAYAEAGADVRGLDLLDQRIANWRALFDRRNGGPATGATTKPSLVPAQFSGIPGSGANGMPGGAFGGSPGMGMVPGMGNSGGMGGFSGGFGAVPGGMDMGRSPWDAGYTQGNMAGGVPKSNRMVLVDVVMVRTEDSIATSRGVNLLGALSLQFGSQSGPAYSRQSTATDVAPGSTLVTRGITVPALAYSLNLANANSNLNEVLARPTLAAVDGLRSEFFSGTSLNAAVVSTGNSLGGSAVSIEKKYGVRLSVQPQILEDGMLRLTVDAARTFLKPPSANIGFTYKLEISEIVASANVVMRLGDTLILGGLSEKESTNNRDGVPFLQDIPGLQYLFSQQSKTDFQRSVLILITPRAATYSWLSEETKAAIAAEPANPFAPSLDVLRARYTDWFKPYPNLASVFHHLNWADLYREFRTGDVTLESWERMKTTPERLRQALEFLHY